MTHQMLNRSTFANDSAPDRTARLEETIKQEQAVLRSAPRDSIDGRTAARNLTMLEEVLTISKCNDRARDQLHAEIEGRRKAERDAVEEKRRTALVDQLRAAYLESPGVSESDFQEALPGLLKLRAEGAALSAETELDRQMEHARASGKYSI